MLDAPRRRRAQLDALHGYEQIRDRLSAPLFEVTDRIAAYRWDLPELRDHLRALSRAMLPEIDALLDLDNRSAAAA